MVKVIGVGKLRLVARNLKCPDLRGNIRRSKGQLNDIKYIGAHLKHSNLSAQSSSILQHDVSYICLTPPAFFINISIQTGRTLTH